jgi:hypothetical protein
MAFLDDLIKAGAVMNKGIQDTRIAEEVTTAHQQMQAYKDQLQQGSVKQDEFRRQTNSLAQQLTANLIKLDADPTRIQQAFAAIAPKSYGSSTEARMAGETKMADEMDKIDFDNKKKLLKMSSAIESEAKYLDYWGTAGAMEQMKLGMKYQKDSAKRYVDGMVLADKSMDEKVARANAGAIYKARGHAAPAKVAVQTYLDAVKKHGNVGLGPEANNDVATKRQKALMALKNFYELGVLQKIDEEAIDKSLGKYGLLTLNSTTEAGAASMLTDIDSSLNSFSESQGFRNESDEDFTKNYMNSNLKESAAPITSPKGNGSFIKYFNPALEKQMSSRAPAVLPAEPSAPVDVLSLSDRKADLEKKLTDRGALAKESNTKKVSQIKAEIQSEIKSIDNQLSRSTSTDKKAAAVKSLMKEIEALNTGSNRLLPLRERNAKKKEFLNRIKLIQEGKGDVDLNKDYTSSSGTFSGVTIDNK